MNNQQRRSGVNLYANSKSQSESFSHNIYKQQDYFLGEHLAAVSEDDQMENEEDEQDEDVHHDMIYQGDEEFYRSYLEQTGMLESREQ